MFWLLQSTYPWSDLGIYESHRFWSSSSQLKVQVNSRVKTDSFPLVKWQRHSNTYYSFNCLTPKSLTTKYRQSMVWTCTISGEPLSLRDFFSSIISARWQLMSLSQGANNPWPETVSKDSSASATVFQNWPHYSEQNGAASSTKHQLKTLLTF